MISRDDNRMLAIQNAYFRQGDIQEQMSDEDIKQKTRNSKVFRPLNQAPQLYKVAVPSETEQQLLT